VEELAGLVKRALEALELVERELERFESAVLEGSLAAALRLLEERYRVLAEGYPPARPYWERARLLRRYVEALRVRASLYGLRGYFREAEYVASHVRDLRAFLVNLDALLGGGRRASVSGPLSGGRFRVHPEE